MEGVDDDILSLLQTKMSNFSRTSRKSKGKEVEYIFFGGVGALVWDFQKQTELFPNPVVFMSCIYLL
jgi:hypothetical protein